MKTNDLIQLFNSVSGITDIVGSKIVNSRMPTRDATTGELDVPFLWLQFRNDLTHDIQNPIPGEQPMGKVYDVEAVSATADQAEALRDAVYAAAHGFSGTAGAAHADMMYVEDQADDYAPRSAPADAGVFVSSLLIQVIGE